MIVFFYCLLLYIIFSISFSQEEQIHDFLAFTSHKVFKPETIMKVIETPRFKPTPNEPETAEAEIVDKNVECAQFTRSIQVLKEHLKKTWQ